MMTSRASQELSASIFPQNASVLFVEITYICLMISQYQSKKVYSGYQRFFLKG